MKRDDENRNERLTELFLFEDTLKRFLHPDADDAREDQLVDKMLVCMERVRQLHTAIKQNEGK